MSSTAAAFCEWLNKHNGSAYSATNGVLEILKGFKKDDFSSDRGYHVRGGSSIVAWRRGQNYKGACSKIVIVASHTDSPGLRTRPHDRMQSENCQLLGVAPYGGGLWYTWFDRPLGVSGCVTGKRKEDGKIVSQVIRIPFPIAIVPSLCIHLQNREEAQSFKPQLEESLRPVLCCTPPHKNAPSEKPDPDEQMSLRNLILTEYNTEFSEVLSYDLSLYDTAPACIFGLSRDMISAPGLDNKSSLWTSFKALAELEPEEIDDRLIVCIGFDHEEVGSLTNVGAFSNLLDSVMKSLGIERWSDAFVLSCDAAHAIHPNYASKHQGEHKPHMNGGTVIKVNANWRYATTSDSIGVLRNLAKQNLDLQLQEFVVRNDSPCGTTIGPMTAAKSGCTTVDVGIPIWAMHSCREVCGVYDIDQLMMLIKLVAKSYEVPPFTSFS